MSALALIAATPFICSGMAALAVLMWARTAIQIVASAIAPALALALFLAARVI